MAGEQAFITGRKVIDALIEAGIADANTVRVVLDIPVNGLVTAYVQKVGDDRVLDVVATLTSNTVVFADTAVTEDTESGRK